MLSLPDKNQNDINEASSCFLGDMLSAGEGCEMAITTRVKTA